jgi:hypothetical protein
VTAVPARPTPTRRSQPLKAWCPSAVRLA